MNLRPTTFNDIVGQDKVKQRLLIMVDAAKKQQISLPHILLDGGPGLGKTTLAQVIANEYQSKIQIINAANIRKITHILPPLMKIEENSILFIDEIHRLSAIVCEFLYPVMEDFRLDLSTKEDTITMSLPTFSLIGATTGSGRLPPPLIDRFQYKFHLELYSQEQLTQIIQFNSQKIGLDMPPSCAIILAGASKNTPRIANSLLRWIQDYIIGSGACGISERVVKSALDLADIDLDGLDRNDKKYLETLKKFRAHVFPIGLDTISAASSIHKDTIQEQIEPFLLRKGIIKKTPKGRQLV